MAHTCNHSLVERDRRTIVQEQCQLHNDFKAIQGHDSTVSKEEEENSNKRKKKHCVLSDIMTVPSPQSLLSYP